MYQMTYKKANGDIIRRTINNTSPYKIGDKTSMGWTVLDIKYCYRGKYYSRSEYYSLVDKEIYWYKKINSYKRELLKIYNNLLYPIALLIMIRFLESL